MPSVSDYRPGVVSAPTKHSSMAVAWLVSDEICSKLAARSSTSHQFVFVFVHHAEHYNVGVFQNGEVLQLAAATNATFDERFGDAIIIAKNASRAVSVPVHLFDDGTAPKTVRNAKTWAPAVRAAEWCRKAGVEATVVCDTYNLSNEIIQQHASPYCKMAAARAEDIGIASDDNVIELLGSMPLSHAKPIMLIRSVATDEGRVILANKINSNAKRHAV